MDDLKEISALLCERFKITPPRIELRPRTNRGQYRVWNSTIRVAKQAWRGRIPSFLHEFAHHLQRVKCGWNPRPHGKSFKRCLAQVVEAFYGKLESYPWESEYASVKAWGERAMKKTTKVINYNQDGAVAQNQNLLDNSPSSATQQQKQQNGDENMYTKADRAFTSALVKKYYPEDYLRLHGNTILTKDFVITQLTRKEQLLKAKELKIPYFNSMRSEELAQAIEHRVAGRELPLEAIIAEAKARFWEHRKKYQLGGVK